MLFLENGEGIWTVERLSNPASLTVATTGRTLGCADDLARVMAFADKDVFSEHLRLDLGDLDMRSLDSDAVKDRIFASSLTGAGVSRVRQ